ncbi:MAG TPA: choice-of-anchor D domain-containing protein [Polyangia bacterium]|nr:choice-of-anchor D domain-containing protein [Polyangia bacterium]
MNDRAWRVGRKAGGLLRLALLALLGSSLGSCTEPRDTTGSELPLVDGGDGSMTVVVPPLDARPDGDAAGEGGTPAHLVLDKTAHDFGLVLINTPSATAEFAVSNDGGAASGGVTATLTASGAGFSIKSDECMGKPLLPGARCRVAVIFSPTAAGKVQGTLAFNATGFNMVATLAAEGITPGALQIAPMTQDFGSVVPPAASGSQTFTITNTGQQKSGAIATTLLGTEAKSFEITADGCMGQMLATQQTCQITVRFTPTALGAKSISIKLAADPGGSAVAQLTGTGISAGSVVFTPSAFDFGSVQQGKPGMSRQFIAQNKGQATTAKLSTAVSTTDFAVTVTGDTCTGNTLVANAMCTVTVQFLPSTPGSKLATLSVTELGGGTATAQLTGTSLANPVLKLTPAVKDFNSVAVGSSATVMFLVSNDGDVASSAPMAPVLGGTDAAQFSVPAGTNGCTAAIPAKGSCMLSVRFAPTTTGVKNATLTVSATAGGPSTATLAGTGITPGVLTLNLTSFDFHGVQQNTVSPVATFSLTNTGQAITGPVTARIVGSAVFTIVSNLCNQMTLAPSNSCSLTVRFEPMAPGPVSSTLEITASPGGAVTASLNGTGLAPASLVINPTAFTFASTVVAGSSANQTFSVTNTGGVAAGTGTSLVGVLGRTDAADFRLVTSNCAGILAPGNSCMIVVAFAPKSAGDKSASLTVSGTPGGNAVAAIAGRAQNAAKLTVTVASGSSSAFGNVLVTSSSDKTFVVTNTGDQSTSAVGVTLTSTAGSGFSLLTPTTGECMPGTTTLGGGSSCTVRVRFAPTVAGTQSATLGASATTGGTASLGLTATGQRNAALTGTNSNNFGTVVIGKTTGTVNWTVINGGDVATGLPTLVNSNSNEVMVTSNSCNAPIAGGASCVIGLAFRPSNSGTRTGTLTLSATPGGSVTFTATADGQAAAGLALAPANGSVTNFGNVLVGANLTETFMLTNTGQQPTTAVTVTLNTAAGSGFALVAPTTSECVSGTTTLAGGASCAIRVRFTAPGPGMQTATLAASATAGGMTTPLALVGNGQRQAMLSGTTTNNYGTLVLGTTSAAVTWTISNGGDVATGAPTLTNSNPGEVIVEANTCTVAVAGGGRCTISASFRPSSDGARTGTLTLTATPGGSVTFTASASGLKPTALTLAPDTGASTNFGNVQVGSNVVQTFVLTNTGQQASPAVTVALNTAASSGFALVAPAAGECTSTMTTLAGGARCNIRVRFTAPGPGVQTATLGASAANGVTAAPLSLSGNGQRPAHLTGSPSGGDFGGIVVGATSGGMTWTLTNDGDMPTSVPTLANNNPTEVMVGQNTCTAALGGGATCSIAVSFRPSTPSPPQRVGTLTLSATTGGSVTFAASATGLSAASLTLAPDTGSQVDFGSVLIGDTRDQVFIVNNGGQQATSALTISFAGDDFMLTPQANDCANGRMLAAGEVCRIHIRFSPTADVARTASLGVGAATGGSGALTLVGLGQTRATLTLTAGSGRATTDLGYVLVGDTATAAFALRNGGDQEASGISIGLTTAPGFSRGTGLADDCGASLVGGKTCQIRVLFTPLAAGSSSTTLSVNATIGGTTATFAVSGIGQPRAIFTPSINNATSGPDEIAMAGNRVWFSETAAGMIGSYDPTTGMITEYPLSATSAPVGIAAAPDGSLWFTESGTDTIGRLVVNPDSTVSISEFPMRVGMAPTGLALGADGAFWFTEAAGNGIGQMTPAGDYTAAAAMLTPGAKPHGIALGPDGKLWFTEPGANSIGAIQNTVSPVMEQPMLSSNAGPFGIAGGSDGRVWFTEQNGNRIGAVTTTGGLAGTMTEYAIPTAGSQPAGITQGSDNFIWFVEQAGGKVARITPAGVVTEFAITVGNGALVGTAPQSIVSSVDGSGTLYVADPGTHKVLKVSF